MQHTLDAKFISPFILGTVKTLSIQAQVAAQAGKPFPKGSQAEPEFGIAGIIGITSSAFTGSINLLFPETVYLKIMEGMLGEPCLEMTADLRDGAGELLNIIFGSAKVILNEQGYNIVKAIPTIIQGKSVQVFQSTDVSVLVIPFQTEFGSFHIEVSSQEVVK